MGIKRYKNVSQNIANNKIDCNKKIIIKLMAIIIKNW